MGTRCPFAGEALAALLKSGEQGSSRAVLLPDRAYHMEILSAGVFLEYDPAFRCTAVFPA